MKSEITKEARKITSITLSEFLEAGGKIEKLETLNRGEGDHEIHVFAAADRDGTYTSDNAGVSWYDSEFERVIQALRAGDTSSLPDSKSVSEI